MPSSRVTNLMALAEHTLMHSGSPPHMSHLAIALRPLCICGMDMGHAHTHALQPMQSILSMVTNPVASSLLMAPRAGGLAHRVPAVLAVDPHEVSVRAVDDLAEGKIVIVCLIIPKRTRRHALPAAGAQVRVVDYYLSHRVTWYIKQCLMSVVIYFLMRASNK